MGWRRFFRRSAWDDERARELESYVDIETEENVARGMTAQEARDRARRKLGNLTRIREEIYDMNTVPLFDTLWRDLRYGARLLRLNPGFALVAILSLALGIGANTAIFQLLDAVRLRTLPVKAPQQLVEVRITHAPHGRTGTFTGPRPQMTSALWEQIRGQQKGFSGVFAWGGGSFNLAPGGEARFAEGLWVSGDFFDVLGVSPVLGRVLGPQDDVRGCASPAAVISYAFWQREYGRASSVLGRHVRLEGHTFEIVGVTPPEFFGVQVGRTFDVAVPLCAEAVMKGEGSAIGHRSYWWLSVMGRLRPAWSQARATAQLEAISPGVVQATLPEMFAPDDAADYLAFRLTAFPAATGISPLRGTYENPLWLLLSITGLVLLTACANLANLALARASARQQEIAIRLAIGASRGRVMRQLLAESLLLATFGAAFGVLLAQGLSRFLVTCLSTPASPLFLDLTTDWRVLGFTAAVAVAACVLFGLAPAVRGTRLALGAVMRTADRRSSDSRERLGLRRALVVVQVALSVVLVAAALLFATSFRNLSTLDVGFRQDGLAIAEFDFARLDVSGSRRALFQRDLVDRLSASRLIDSAARTSVIPLTGDFWNERVRTEPNQPPKGLSNASQVSAGYFRTMGTPLVAGRDFDDRDTPASPKVAIVNESFARHFLGSGAPIGRTFRFEAGAGDPEPVYQVIGLVRDTKYGDLREALGPIAFLPASQEKDGARSLRLVLRSRAPLADVLALVKRTIAEVNPAISLRFRVFSTVVRESLVRERLMATLSGLFGCLAGLLAAIGLYGVTAYMVARRRNEIGIRMALGADRLAVVRLVMRDTAALLGIGLITGSVLAIASGRAATSLLFGITPWDPGTIALTVAGLALVGSVASFVPARRAARLSPLDALRDE